MTHDSKNALPINVLNTTSTWPATPPRESWWKRLLGSKKRETDWSDQIRLLTNDEMIQLPTSVIGELVSNDRVLSPNGWVVDDVPNSELYAATKQEAYKINVFGEKINPEEQRDPRSRFDQQWVGQQLSSVSRSFGVERFDNSRRVLTHHLQEYTYGGKRYNGQRVSSCVAASVYNALDVLGLRNGLTETEIIEQIGGFNAIGSMATQYINLLRKNGLTPYACPDLCGICLELQRGSVVILMSNNHAKMVSGYKSDGSGGITFTVNNPLEPAPETYTSRQLAESIAAGARQQSSPHQDGLYSVTDAFFCTVIPSKLEIKVQA